jgi:hypothetical protein
LHGIGYAFTLTLRDCPKTAKEYIKIRKAFILRLKRMFSIRIHWLTEWQLRGVPHLHGCVYFKDTEKNLFLANGITSHWLDLTRHLGTQKNSQKVVYIRDILGWKKYLSKHGSRGVNHYQRSEKNIPKGWVKTGRMWGHTGDWPTQEIKIELDEPAFYSYRRLLRSWRKADARKAKNRFRIKSARSMLKCNLPNLSRTRGVSEWIDLKDSLALLEVIKAMGHKVEC